MKIYKFGGTSLGSANAIQQVGSIIKDVYNNGNTVVVFSAFEGVTDMLIKAARSASKNPEESEKIFIELEQLHFSRVQELVPSKHQSSAMAEVRVLLNELHHLLQGIYFLQELTPRTLDSIMSYGEQLSAYIMSEYLLQLNLPAEYVDTRNLIITDSAFGSANVHYNKTQKHVQDRLQNIALPVCTGFIAADEAGQTTTLGRGGSDFTAAILAEALEAIEIQIWTDTNGVLTADPAKVADAFSIHKLTYEEAMELSYYGAKVIYPPTLKPAQRNNIPLRVRNTFNPHFEGTLVSNEGEHTYAIAGVSSIGSIALLQLEGTGMIGVPDVSKRLFKALSDADINVVLLSQGSSEHSICFAIEQSSMNAAIEVVEKEFRYEIEEQTLNNIYSIEDCCIVAIAGEQMMHRTGVSGTLFTTLGRNGVNVLAIAQGASERNISVVITKEDEQAALNAIHRSFFFVSKTDIHLFLIGPGLIGKNLLSKLQQQSTYLQDELGIHIHLNGIIDSKKMLISKEEIPLNSYKQMLEESSESANLQSYAEQCIQLNMPGSICVDCTASDKVPEHYIPLLNKRIAVVTPNKKANSASHRLYSDLIATAKERYAPYLYETNVCAGLPVINTLNDLQTSGDKIHCIEGMLSGTLSYIFNTYNATVPFSEVVRTAQEQGFTEPDPREDLNGMDVLRKILILARECGMQLEPDDVTLEPFISEQCFAVDSVKEFYTELKKEDAVMADMYNNAKKQNKHLRFVAKLENGTASVALDMVQDDHPFASLKGSDNMVMFTTEYYKHNPLVIRGPGAGADVTASGVLADIVKAAQKLSARSFSLVA